MSDLLSNMYPWVKALHVISVISWMAGLLYLPRLMVHHVEQVNANSETDKLFQMMEVKLYRLIMNPAMIATWIFGLTLAFTPGIVAWSEGWPWVKAIMVIGMTLFHHWLGRRRKELTTGTCETSGKQFRLMNEVPTVLMIIIVIMIIARPF
ncbi:MAG: protoporphyrinogen oxidase HemJ [Alphaproteobacteria bacterium]|nr:protoporphyrinogen oxidase HemJ [Alphaproteobacteria bacterium]